jgi:hypothetical protein
MMVVVLACGSPAIGHAKPLSRLQSWRKMVVAGRIHIVLRGGFIDGVPDVEPHQCVFKKPESRRDVG